MKLYKPRHVRNTLDETVQLVMTSYDFRPTFISAASTTAKFLQLYGVIQQGYCRNFVSSSIQRADKCEVSGIVLLYDVIQEAYCHQRKTGCYCPVICRVYNLSLLPLIKDQEDITEVTPTGEWWKMSVSVSRDLPSVQLVIATSDTISEYKRTHLACRSDVLVSSGNECIISEYKRTYLARSDVLVSSGSECIMYNLSLLPLIQGYKIRETPLVEVNVSVSCDLPSVQLVIATSDTRIQDQGDPASDLLVSAVRGRRGVSVAGPESNHARMTLASIVFHYKLIKSSRLRIRRHPPSSSLVKKTIWKPQCNIPDKPPLPLAPLAECTRLCLCCVQFPPAMCDVLFKCHCLARSNVRAAELHAYVIRSYSFAKSRIISSKAVLVQQRRERRLGVRWRSTRAADNKNDLDSPATACGSERGNKQVVTPRKLLLAKLLKSKQIIILNGGILYSQ
ncbi:hypothetical protein J6590_021491 [Homalodisca vitripennis]|nr:hypothetical protein J6590_021491 [Homalodisca vitripennis]